MSILRSMCSGTKKNKTYDMKQTPKKGNEANLKLDKDKSNDNNNETKKKKKFC